MANSIFSLTPIVINKVVGGAWNDDSQILCYVADALAQINTDKAKGEFVATLAKLGIKLVATSKLADNIIVETFNASGKQLTEMSDDDKRKAISVAIFKTDTNAPMFAQFSGEMLETMYQANVKPDKQSAPYQLYRVTLGEHTLYRVSNDGESISSLVSKGIRHVTERGADESQFKIEMPA